MRVSYPVAGMIAVPLTAIVEGLGLSSLRRRQYNVISSETV